MGDFLEVIANDGVLYGGNSKISNVQASGAIVFTRNSKNLCGCDASILMSKI
jgi:hypothetical protein